MILIGSGFGKGPTGVNSMPGYGASYKRGVRELYGTRISLRAYGERIPDYDNYFEIGPDGLTDSLGIPQVRFHVQNRENELKMIEHMFF